MRHDAKERYLIRAFFFVFIIISANIMAFGAIYQPSQQSMDDDGNNKIGNTVNVGESQRYILIKKEVVPNKQTYMPNEDITIFVEMRLLKYRSMDEKIKLSICEQIDSNLSLTNKPSIGLITSNLTNLHNYKNMMGKFNGSDSRLININWGENYAESNMIEMNSWERLVYSYNVKPKRAGTFSTNTIARTAYFSDVDQKLDIDVNKAGLYEVSIIPSKGRVFQKETLQIYYTITYLGDGQTGSIIEFENETNKPFSYDSNFNTKVNLSKYESIMIPVDLTYTKKGSYTLPGIFIDGSYFIEDKSILVDSFFERYWQFLQIIILIITIISSVFAFIKYSAEKTVDKTYSLYNLITEIKNDILESIKDLSVRATILLGSLIMSLAIYMTACVIDPGQFVSTFVFVIDNWIWFNIAFLVLFIYIIYKIQKYNLKHHNEDLWGNWAFNGILIIFWSLLIYIMINFSKIKDFIF